MKIENRHLIYDLGMHRGLDTKFYLNKGFRVVALEANPQMVADMKQECAKQIESGQLVIVDKALWHEGGTEISFYVNNTKDDWSSAFKNWAEKGGHQSVEITVSTITLSEMFDQYGLPYYVKCDVEGADEIFVKQLARETRRPAFASVEAMSLEVLAHLVCGGYDRVQYVNQAFNHATKSPDPPLEGNFAEVRFNGHMSGLFGLELPANKWHTFSHVAELWLRFRALKAVDPLLAHGWVDFHVTTADTLAMLKNESPASSDKSEEPDYPPI